MRDVSLIELTVRLLVAALAGLVVGVERELRGHVAGARTHALVAVGAALFTMAGAYGFADVPRATTDPARVAAQVASGIGFLGAGAILRQGLGVKGLTTAATLWLAAAIGVASGSGAYASVLVGTGVVLVVLVVLRLLKPLLTRWGGVAVLELEYERGHGTLGPLLRAVNDLSGRLDRLEVIDEDEDRHDGLRHVSLALSGRDSRRIASSLDELRSRPEIRRVRLSTSSSAVDRP